MDKKKSYVILGTAHLETTPGKCSPDKVFREFRYSREIVERVRQNLVSLGYNVFVDYPGNTPNSLINGQPGKSGQDKELNFRKNFVNNICAKYGSSNCIYVSIHVNAAGGDGKWKSAGGWCIYSSPGKTKADTLATCIFSAAEKNLTSYISSFNTKKLKGLYDSKQRPLRSDYSDGDPDYEARFYVLTRTKCPAVLTENLFQDNKADVEFLTSEEGKDAIAKLHVDGIVAYFKTI